MSDAQAQIFEGGFRPYTGPRLGARLSTRTLYTYSLGRLLGRKRRFRSKLIPIASAVVSWVGAIGLIFWAALFALIIDVDFDTVRGYYRFAWIGIVLFSILATPTLLTTDRRSGLLSLYLASPLSRTRYLGAQTMAIHTLLVALSLVPVLILGIVYTALGVGPGNAGDFAIFVLRAIAASISLALLPTALGVAICSAARRAGIAMVLIALCLLVPQGIVNLLVEVAGAPAELGVLDPMNLSWSLTKRSFALPLESGTGVSPVESVATWVVVLATLGWSALLGGFALWRYRRVEVER
ncbi:MAG: hypothetical protein OXI26_09130 [bacterium]|nr:hypothetical protein [bacterium]